MKNVQGSVMSQLQLSQTIEVSKGSTGKPQVYRHVSSFIDGQKNGLNKEEISEHQKGSSALFIESKEA